VTETLASRASPGLLVEIVEVHQRGQPTTGLASVPWTVDPEPEQDAALLTDGPGGGRAMVLGGYCVRGGWAPNLDQVSPARTRVACGSHRLAHETRSFFPVRMGS
jgi:hypothetical protein